MMLSMTLPIPAAKIRAERRLEGREHDQVQERCHPAEE